MANIAFLDLYFILFAGFGRFYEYDSFSIFKNKLVSNKNWFSKIFENNICKPKFKLIIFSFYVFLFSDFVYYFLLMIMHKNLNFLISFFKILTQIKIFAFAVFYLIGLDHLVYMKKDGKATKKNCLNCLKIYAKKIQIFLKISIANQQNPIWPN